MERHPSTDTRTFRLLYVCTGNICRSPFAEILTRHLLVGRLGGRKAAAFEISSAGVQAMIGAQMHPDTRDELTPWGLDGVITGRFEARQLRSTMLERSDLVLGASPGHRSSAVQRRPATLPIAFTVREFARIVASVEPSSLPVEPVARAHALVASVQKRRGLVPPHTSDGDRIPDPMGRSPEAHHDTAVLIYEAVRVIVNAMAPARACPVDLAAGMR